MCYDRVTTINDLGIITTLVEHTHIQSEYIGHIDRTSHTAFVRADDHHAVLVNMKTRSSFEKSFDKLIYRLNCLKSVKRDSVLYTWVVGIEGNDVIHTHFGKLLKSQSTVQRFTSVSLMLTSFI